MKLGVLVGRFQTPALTSTQIQTINRACNDNDEIAVFLLDLEISFCTHNPINFNTREQLVTNYIQKAKTKPVRVYRIRDEKYASRVKDKIDRILLEAYAPDTKMTMYGNDFVEIYDGICDKVVLNNPIIAPTASSLRIDAMNLPLYPSERHAAGQIYAVSARESVCHTYVVVVPYLRLQSLNVLAQTPNRYVKLSFPMIRVNGLQKNFINYAKECLQEFLPLAGQVEFKPLHAMIVNDWRFRKSRDTCIYIPVLAIIGNKPALKDHITVLDELREKDFEEEFHPIITTLNTAL